MASWETVALPMLALRAMYHSKDETMYQSNREVQVPTLFQWCPMLLLQKRYHCSTWIRLCTFTPNHQIIRTPSIFLASKLKTNLTIVEAALPRTIRASIKAVLINSHRIKWQRPQKKDLHQNKKNEIYWLSTYIHKTYNLIISNLNSNLVKIYNSSYNIFIV